MAIAIVKNLYNSLSLANISQLEIDRFMIVRCGVMSEGVR